MDKPVWRVNSGAGVPSDLGDMIMFANGALSKPWFADFIADGQWFLTGKPSDYAAYQTNRTRKAKYERVECGECDYTGVICNYSDEVECPYCYGKGYILKPIK